MWVKIFSLQDGNSWMPQLVEIQREMFLWGEECPAVRHPVCRVVHPTYCSEGVNSSCRSAIRLAFCPAICPAIVSFIVLSYCPFILSFCHLVVLLFVWQEYEWLSHKPPFWWLWRLLSIFLSLNLTSTVKSQCMAQIEYEFDKISHWFLYGCFKFPFVVMSMTKEHSRPKSSLELMF